MFFVGAIVDRFSRLRVEFLASPTANGAIELNVRRVKLGLAGLERTIETLDQSGYFVTVKIAIVVVQVVEVGRLLVLGFVVAAFHAPNVGPMR